MSLKALWGFVDLHWRSLGRQQEVQPGSRLGSSSTLVLSWRLQLEIGLLSQLQRDSPVSQTPQGLLEMLSQEDHLSLGVPVSLVLTMGLRLSKPESNSPHLLAPRWFRGAGRADWVLWKTRAKLSPLCPPFPVVGWTQFLAVVRMFHFVCSERPFTVIPWL